jgi:N-acyl amino acid synthase of PEP-CTERM/exosortase system
MEQDHYDSNALHCLLRDRANAQAIGTVRLVQPVATPTWFAGLPLTEYAPQESMEDILQLPAGTTAEVSRFAITRAAREILRGPARRSSQPVDEATLGEKLLPYMSLGLIRGLVRLSMQHGITHWCLAAEPSLLRRLRGFGLHFRDAGPLVEHRGLRQICYAELGALLDRARAEHPEFWDVITVGGFLLSADLPRAAA